MKKRKGNSNFFKLYLIGFVIGANLVAIIAFYYISISNARSAPDIISSLSLKSNCFYYSQLNKTEADIYNELLKTVEQGQTSCTIENVITLLHSKSAITAAVNALTYDHPEYYWIRNGYTCQWSDGLYGTIKIDLYCYDYWNYSLDYKKHYIELKNKVQEIVDEANLLSSDYEKSLFVHDYIIENVEYDYDGLNEHQKTIHDANCEYIYSAYGCLVNKKCVCAGYAKAYSLVMNSLDINCSYVTGDTTGGHHAWNLIELDDEWYFTDVTWDDMGVNYLGEPRYNYFCVTSDQISVDHTPDTSEFSIPICTGTQYNYFTYNNYQLSYYDFDSAANIFDQQADNNIVSIKFTNEEAYNEATVDLFDNSFIHYIPSLSPYRLSYILYPSFLIIDIFKE